MASKPGDGQLLLEAGDCGCSSSALPVDDDDAEARGCPTAADGVPLEPDDSVTESPAMPARL